MNIYTGLLFQHGHIADPALAVALAEDPASAASSPKAPAPRARTSSSASRTAPAGGRGLAARLLHNLAYLGGRPMTVGHNADIDEPFPQLVGTAPAKRSARSKPCVTFKHGAIAAVCGTVALSPFR